MKKPLSFPRLALRWAACAYAAAALSACHTLSKEHCEQMDWHGLGYEAAIGNKSLDRQIGYYERNCTQDWGIHPDQKAIDAGYRKGIADVCTPSGIRNYASQGFRYPSFCPAEKEKEFQTYYQSGQLNYLTHTVNELNDEVRGLRDRVGNQNVEIDRLRSELERERSRK